jgi:protocatechuate 3,4-dioxygenase beta subunit
VQQLSRRRAFQLAGVAGASAVVAACSGNPAKKPVGAAASKHPPPKTSSVSPSSAADAGCATAMAAETAGPYPADGSNGPNVLGQEGVVRHDIRTSFGGLSGWAEGVATTIELTLVHLPDDCGKAQGMAVYVWHCDRDADYSLYGNAADKNYLRGVQLADQDGRVSFTSIFPGCEADRWPHINVEVFDSPEAAVTGANARLRSQIALPRDGCTTVYDHDKAYGDSAKNLSNAKLESDSVFGDGADAHLATVTGDPESATLVTATIGLSW